MAMWVNQIVEYLASGCSRELYSVIDASLSGPEIIERFSNKFQPSAKIQEEIFNDLIQVRPHLEKILSMRYFLEDFANNSTIDPTDYFQIYEAIENIVLMDQVSSELYSLKLYAHITLGNLSSYIGKDKRAAEHWIDAHNIYLTSQPDKSMPHLNRLIANSLVNLGTYYSQTGCPNLAEKTLLSAIAIFDAPGEEKDIEKVLEKVGCLITLGIVFQQQAKFDRAKRYLEDAHYTLGNIENTQAKKYEALVHVNLGNLYSKLRQLNSAKVSYLKALKIQRQISRQEPSYENHYELSGTLNNLGLLSNQINSLDESEQYYLEARDIRLNLAQINSFRYLEGLTEVYNNIGILYFRKNEIKDAIQYLQATDKNYTEIAAKTGINKDHERIGVLINMSLIHNRLRSFDVALDYLFKASAILDNTKFDELPNKSLLYVQVHQSMGKVHNEKGDYSSALYQYELVASILSELDKDSPGSIQWQRVINYNDQAVVHSSLGNPISSLNLYLKSHEILNDLVKNEKDGESNFAHELARCGLNIGSAYITLRRFSEARNSIEVSKNRYIRLAKKHPETFNKHLASAYVNLAAIDRKMNERESSIENSLNADRIYDAMSQWNLEQISIAKANNLISLASFIVEGKSPRSALRYQVIARKILQKAFYKDPQANAYDYYRSLNQMAIFYATVGKNKIAHRLYKASLNIISSLSEHNHQSFFLEKAGVEQNLGNLFANEGVMEVANRHYRNAVSIVETQSDEEQIDWLRKGQISTAYKASIFANFQNPELAFRFAVALRESHLVKDIDRNASQQAQEALLVLEKSLGKKIQILIPNSLGQRKLLLGFLNSDSLIWKEVNFENWEDIRGSLDLNSHSEIRELAVGKFFQSLSPEVLVQLNLDKPSLTTLICGDEMWTRFPWELLSKKESSESFYGTQTPLARIPSISAEFLKTLLPDVSKHHTDSKFKMQIFAPHTIVSPRNGILFPLSSSYEEAMTILHDTERLDCAVQCFTGENANEDRFRNALNSQSDIIYFSGHGGIHFDHEFLFLHSSQNTSSYPDSDIAFFGVENLRSMKSSGKLFFHNPIFILNCCATGRVKSFGGNREDLIAQLLEMGAGAVLATSYPLRTLVGKKIGDVLIRYLQSSRTIGEASTKIRSRLRNELVDSKKFMSHEWADIHLHGNPFLPLRIKNGTAERELNGNHY